MFCRECGAEYYSVSRLKPDETGAPARLLPRALVEQAPEQGEPGFLYLSEANPWPRAEADYLDRLPDDWVEETSTGRHVRSDRREWVPQNIDAHPDGRLGLAGEPGTQDLAWHRCRSVSAWLAAWPTASPPAPTYRS